MRYRALALLATFASMRWGELVGLHRENIDLDVCEIRIVETTAELDRGGMLQETPKSKAARRTVSFPAELVPELRWHLERFSQPGDRGPVFVGPKGAPLRRSNFRPIWNNAYGRAGMPDLHFHDLRHVGGTLAAATGASLKELMARLGHSSTPVRADLPARDQGQGSGHRQGPWRPGATGPADQPRSGQRRRMTSVTVARLWPEPWRNEVQ